MTLVFWFAAALLVAGALLFVLPPLLQAPSHALAGSSPFAAYREQRVQLDAELAQGTVSIEAHARGIAELLGRVAEEVGDLPDTAALPVRLPRRVALAIALSVALSLTAGVAGLYATLGQPGALKPYGVDGTVILDDSLKSMLPPGATLFVFARAAEGPRTPVAILRVPAGEFPQRFRLDDSLAMSPDSVLSSHSLVVIGARISPSGDATPRPGDLVGELGPVRYGASGVRLVIDGVAP